MENLSSNGNGSEQSATVCSDFKYMYAGVRKIAARISIPSIVEPDDAYQGLTFSTLYYLDTITHLTGYQKPLVVIQPRITPLSLYYVTPANTISHLTGYQKAPVVISTERSLVLAILARNLLYSAINWHLFCTRQCSLYTERV